VGLGNCVFAIERAADSRKVDGTAVALAPKSPITTPLLAWPSLSREGSAPYPAKGQAWARLKARRIALWIHHRDTKVLHAMESSSRFLAKARRRIASWAGEMRG